MSLSDAYGKKSRQSFVKHMSAGVCSTILLPSFAPFEGISSKGEFNFPVMHQQATQMDGIAKKTLAGRNLSEHISSIERKT